MNDLAIIEQPQTTALASADRATDLAIQIMGFHPGYRDILQKTNEATAKKTILAAAHLALQIGVSPLPATNELHLWHDGKGPQISLGINYFRRKAREIAGGIIYALKQQPRPMTMEECEHYGVGKNQQGAICTGMRVDEFEKWLKAGMKPGDILDYFAVTGTGVVSSGDYAKNGRTKGWTAEKRAEKDLITRLVPEMHGMSASPSAENGYDPTLVTLREENGTLYEETPMDGGGEDLSGKSKEDLAAELFGNSVKPVPEKSLKETVGELVEQRRARQSGDVEEVELSDNDDSTNIENIVHADPPKSEPAAYEDDPFFDEDLSTEAEEEETDNPEADALAARALATFAKAVFRTPFGHVFGDVETVEKAFKYLCKGDPFTAVENDVAFETLKKFATAMMDGAEKREAADAAQNYYDANHDPIPF